METYVKETFYNGPAEFSGPRNVYLEVKKRFPNVTLKQVSDILSEQESYTRHIPRRKTFERNRVVAMAIDSDWQADLCDVKNIKQFNYGYTYILTVIDVLSKYAWAVPIQKKTPEAVVKAFEKILQESGRRPERLFTDRGLEFVGMPFKKYLREQAIQQLTSQNDTTKAAIAERYNRTLKTRLWKYFTYANTKRYVKVLPEIVDAINHSYHRSIKMRPVDVNQENEAEVWQTLYGDMPKPILKFKFHIGDTVRIPAKKPTFSKGYEANFSKEIYTVAERVMRSPPVYKVTNSEGKKQKRVFYQTELVRVRQPPTTRSRRPPYGKV